MPRRGHPERAGWNDGCDGDVQTTVEAFTLPLRSPYRAAPYPRTNCANSNQLWLTFCKKPVWNSGAGSRRSESTAVAQPGRSFAAASTSAAWPSTFTLGQIRAIRPSAPIRKVARVTPRKVLPYMDFLPQTP